MTAPRSRSGRSRKVVNFEPRIIEPWAEKFLPQAVPLELGGAWEVLTAAPPGAAVAERVWVVVAPGADAGGGEGALACNWSSLASRASWKQTFQEKENLSPRVSNGEQSPASLRQPQS